MASFEERVKAAWEAWGQSIGYSKGGVATALRAADAAEPEIGAVRRWLAGEVVDAATLPERLREVLSERDEEALRAAELCRKHVNERPPCSGDEDGCWMCSYEGAVASMDGYIDSTVRAEQERDEARERVAELVTEFDTERSERRAVERQRDEARDALARLKQERDALAAKVREQAELLREGSDLMGWDDECDPTVAQPSCPGCRWRARVGADIAGSANAAAEDAREAGDAAESAQALADAAAKAARGAGEGIDADAARASAEARRVSGYARAAALTPERRREIARNASGARWARHRTVVQDVLDDSQPQEAPPCD